MTADDTQADDPAVAATDTQTGKVLSDQVGATPVTMIRATSRHLGLPKDSEASLQGRSSSKSRKDSKKHPDSSSESRSATLLDHITRPVLNKPHEEPSKHWELAEDNTSTGKVNHERRLSQALVIVPKERGTQLRMQATSAEQNELVNSIRTEVSRWRKDGYLGATAATRQLLHHWRSEANDPRLFFAQVEAAETLIWLTEANANRYRTLGAIRRELKTANHEYNDGIDRLAVRMATGSGKTAVMGMVIAWHAVNAAGSLRRDGRYTTCFLALTPGHTVRERLAVLDPAHPDNIYDEMRLLPENKRDTLGAVKVRVLNFHAFQRRDRLGEAASDAKKLLRRGAQQRAFTEALREAASDAGNLPTRMPSAPPRAGIDVCGAEPNVAGFPHWKRNTESVRAQ